MVGVAMEALADIVMQKRQPAAVLPAVVLAVLPAHHRRFHWVKPLNPLGLVCH